MIEVSTVKQESGDLVLVSIADDAGSGIMTGLTPDQAEQTASELLTAANDCAVTQQVSGLHLVA